MTLPTLTTIQILVPEIEKAAFKSACKLSGSTMTRELRKFMFTYCKDTKRPDRAVYEAWLTEYQLQLFKD